MRRYHLFPILTFLAGSAVGDGPIARSGGRGRAASGRIDAGPEATSQSAERPSRPTTPDDRRAALEAVGVAEENAADLVWRQGQQALDRLDLRDIATREGWFGSDRYRENAANWYQFESEGVTA